MTGGPPRGADGPAEISWTTGLGTLVLAHAIGVATFAGAIAMAPPIRGELGLSATEFGLLASAYAFTQGVFGLPAGSVVDRVGVRRALVAANLLAALSALLLGLAGGFLAALAALGVAGIAYSFVNPATSKGVLLWFPPRRQGAAMGIKQAGVPAGGMLGAGLGALASVVEWRVLLFAVVACAVAGALSCLWLPRGGDPSARLRIDILADIRAVLADRNLNVFNLGVGFYQAAQFNFLSYVTLFMREAVGASQPVAAACLGVAQAASACGRLGWGVVSDLLFAGRRKPVLVLIGLVGTVSLVALALVAPGWIVPGIVVAALIGLTVPGYVALVQNVVVEAAAPQLAATAVGYNRIFAAAGTVVGPPVFGAVVDGAGGYALGWLATAAILLTAVLLIGGLFREGARASDAGP